LLVTNFTTGKIVYLSQKMLQSELIPIFKPLVESVFINEARFIINVDGLILASNNYNLKVFPTIGENLEVFLRPYFSEISIIALSKLAEKRLNYESSFKISSDSKDDYYYKILLTAIDQNPTSIILVQILDITQDKKIEIKQKNQLQRLEEEMTLRTKEIMFTADIMKEQGGFLINYLKGLKHDLKSPVVQLRDIIEYYRLTEDLTKKAKALELIHNCLDKLENTSRGFSDFVDLHFLPVNLIEECNLRNAVEANLALLDATIEKSGAKIKIECKKDVLIVYNKKELMSIIYNVLSNSLKFRNVKTKLQIYIEIRRRNKYIDFLIKDNGIGIDLKKYSEQLFVPFKRFNANIDGLGIGLSLVRSLLNKSGSTIHIESKVDLGTSVHIKLMDQQVD